MEELAVEPLPGGVGVQVHVPVPELLRDDGASRSLRHALWRHGLLLLRGYACSPVEHLALGRVFGEPEPFGPQHVPGHPFVTRITNRAGDGFLNDIGRYWHADGTFLPHPTAVSLWHIVRPGGGGDTLFADMHRALDEMPPDLRAFVEGRRMVSRSGAMHPLVRKHPVTGRCALYTSIRMTDHFEGMTAAESQPWLARIDAHLDRPGAHLRHAWQAGDLVIGDNFAVAHRATPNDPHMRRVLHRVTIRGDRAIYG